VAACIEAPERKWIAAVRQTTVGWCRIDLIDRLVFFDPRRNSRVSEPVEGFGVIEPRHLGAATPARTAALKANDLGLGAYRKRDLEGAARQFEQAIREDSSYVAARVNLASVHAQLGADQQKQALSELALAMPLDPELVRRRMHEDLDFDPLRKDPEFERLLAGRPPPSPK
jgi:hypothetical protein